jgi:hypothetical protein
MHTGKKRGEEVMNESFTKLFNTIITSSIWSADDKTRIMWVTFLALADQNGYVAGSIPGLAAMARMSIEDTKRCIEALESPDEYSRTPDEEGRRLRKVTGGWVLVNHWKYRAMIVEQARKASNREAQRRHRANNSDPSSKCMTGADKVMTSADNYVYASSSVLSNSNANEGSVRGGSLEANPPTVEECIAAGDLIGVTKAEAKNFHGYYSAQGWRWGSGVPMVGLANCLKRSASRQKGIVAKEKANPGGKYQQAAPSDEFIDPNAKDRPWLNMIKKAYDELIMHMSDETQMKIINRHKGVIYEGKTINQHACYMAGITPMEERIEE